MRPPSSPRQPPDTVFHCVSGRKMHVGRARAAGWRRPPDRWRVKLDFAWSGRVRNVAPEGLLRSSPRSAAALITFRRLEPNGHTGPQVTAVGCLAASDHWCGQGIPATGTGHQHGPAWAFLVAPRTYPASPCLLHAFARINSGGIHLCLCRSDTAYAYEASCNDTTPSMPISGVR